MQILRHPGIRQEYLLGGIQFIGGKEPGLIRVMVKTPEPVGRQMHTGPQQKMPAYIHLTLPIQSILPERERCKRQESRGVDGKGRVDFTFKRLDPGIGRLPSEIEFDGIGGAYFKLCFSGIMGYGGISIERTSAYRLAGGVVINSINKPGQVIIIAGIDRGGYKGIRT